METAQGKSAFAMMELNGASLQLLQQKGAMSFDEWNLDRRDLLESAGNQFRIPVSASLIKVFNAEQALRSEINSLIVSDYAGKDLLINRTDGEIRNAAETITREHPQAEMLATQNLKTKLFLRVADEMDRCLEHIQSIDLQLGRLNASASRIPVSEKHLTQLKGQKELLHLKIGSLAILRNRFFDEGYNTQGAYNRACYRLKGQTYQRTVEDFHERLRHNLQSPPLVKSLSEGGEPKPVFKRASTKFDISPDESTSSTTQENISSSLENLVMYKSHYDKSIHEGLSPQKAVVAQSKYSERVLGGLLEIVSNLKVTHPELHGDPRFARLEKEVETNYRSALEMERLKRDTELNHSTTKQMLLNALSNDPNCPFRGAELERRIDQALSKDPKQPFLFIDESILAEDRYQLLVFAMVDLELVEGKGVDQQKNPLTSNDTINYILKGRCGLLPREAREKNREFYDMYKQSMNYTLSACHLSETAEIEQFNDRIQNLLYGVYNYAVNNGFAPKIAEVYNPSLSLDALVQELIPHREDNL